MCFSTKKLASLIYFNSIIVCYEKTEVVSFRRFVNVKKYRFYKYSRTNK